MVEGEGVEIIRASAGDLDLIAPLFDAYRVFYELPSDLALARSYIEARLVNDESVIFLARESAGDRQRGVGFTQLYPTFCSLDAKNVWVLYDLYVEPEARRAGIARMLMNAARAHAEATNAAWIKLDTAHTNKPGQALYESLGYERDEDFHSYYLRIEEGGSG